MAYLKKTKRSKQKMRKTMRIRGGAANQTSSTQPQVNRSNQRPAKRLKLGPTIEQLEKDLELFKGYIAAYDNMEPASYEELKERGIYEGIVKEIEKSIKLQTLQK